MKKQLFTDAVSYIDVDAVERLLQIEQDMERKRLRSRRARLLLIPAAALVVLLVCMTLVIIPFIPKNLDISYEPSEGLPENVWVYYVRENGKQKRELVKQPAGAQNMFASWQHLNELDGQVQLLNYSVTTEPMAGATVEPNTLLEFLQQLGKRDEQTIVTATLSAGITSCENYDALIDSLIQTIAKYAGVSPEQVRILIDGEQIGIAGSLQFYHSLQGGGPVVAELGTTLEITVGVTNISNQIIEYDFDSIDYWYVDALLIMDGTARIMHEDFYILDEYPETVIDPGASREIPYKFIIPEQATCGVYDLVIWSGEQTFTFENAVQIVEPLNVPGVTATEFHEFLMKYGFVTVDVSEFRSAVAQLTYHSGKGMFDILTPARIDYAEGYSGEEYGSDLFAYGYLTEPNGTSNNYFIGLALPDYMRLPHGISPDDRLIDSLYKMGVYANTAQDTVERAQKLSEGEQLALGNEFFDFYITRNSYGEYVILYSFIAAPVAEGAGPPEYSLEIIYSKANMTFTCFRVMAGYEGYSTDAFTAPIQVTPYDMPYVSRELSQEDSEILLQIFNNGTWRSGNVDAKFDYQITSAGKTYSYSASAGVLMSSASYLSLSEAECRTVNEIITVGNYQPSFSSIKLSEINKIVSLPTSVDSKIIKALNNAEWCDGTLELASMLEFVCDGTMVSYSDGTFYTATHYWNADSYTKDITNALYQAIVGVRSGQYDSICYYADSYFGHSDAVDEKLQGTVNFSMNINPQFLDDVLYVSSSKIASTFGDIVDCSKAEKGVLVTINGYYFERITEFDPDFSQGDVILTPYGQPPVEASEEDAQKLREIFARAEFEYCFGDHTALYETTIEIGGYTVAYLSSWGDAKIGDWKATLSEQDCAAVAGILGGYIYVE